MFQARLPVGHGQAVLRELLAGVALVLGGLLSATTRADAPASPHLSNSADWTRTARITTPYDYDEWNGWQNAIDRTVADGASVILDWAALSDTYPGRVLNPAPGLADLQQRIQYVHTHHPGVRFPVYIAPLEMQTPDADTDMDGEPDIPYQVITEADMTAETLAGYDAIVLSLLGAMSPAQAQVIRDYVATGGTIVAISETSLFDAQGQQLADFQLADVFGVSYSQVQEGTVYVHNYGAGQSVFTLDRYASWYFYGTPEECGGDPCDPVQRLPRLSL